jgi:two-component system response regulator MprA
MAERVLIIDDDPDVLDSVPRNLRYEGFVVDVALDGQGGLSLARSTVPDLVILDVDQPDLDGLLLGQRLRVEGLAAPILMLSARAGVADRVAGLEAGADDYLSKPFVWPELAARIRALLRRRPLAADGAIQRYGDLVLNVATREVYRGERRLNLTAREFDLLELFLRHPRQVLTRDIIYDAIWGYDYGGESNVIDAYISYLRKKLEAGGEARLLQTIRGVGYALRED